MTFGFVSDNGGFNSTNWNFRGNRLDHQVLGVLISNTSWQILIYLWKSGGVLGRVPAMYDIAMNRWWQRDPQLINIENSLVNVLMDMKWHGGKHMVSSINSDQAICCNVVLRLFHTIWNDLNFLNKSGGKKTQPVPADRPFPSCLCLWLSPSFLSSA
jgi:hypothetical protein